MGKKVLLAFSGGIDSTFSAQLLVETGYDVSLLTLDTVGDKTMLAQAKATAKSMELPWRKADVRNVFQKEVIDYFIGSYLQGETPVPCTVCNPAIKWRMLYKTAIQEGFDHIATGHYFRLSQHGKTYFIKRAVDTAKDQSHYLWGVPQIYLKMALTPMGEQIKEQVKSRNSDKHQRESMGICFLNGRNYTDYLRQNVSGIKPGIIVNRQGEKVGSHKGYPYYTIGQKRDLEVAFPCCVTGIDVEANRLIVGDDKDLYHHHLALRNFHVPDMERLLTSKRLSVMIRGYGRNPTGYAQAYLQDNRLCLTLEEPAWAVAKGQSIVIYEDDLVVGGGFLENYW